MLRYRLISKHIPIIIIENEYPFVFSPDQIQTVHDHRMEIIDYYREFKLNGILGLNADYIIAGVHHYYSSHDLRLSYTGSIETKEFLVPKMFATLGLGPEHLPYMAVFLSGKLALERDTLRQMWKTIKVEYAAEFEARARELAKVVREAPVGDVNAFVKHLKLDQWSAYIKETVEYYQRKGTYAKSGKKIGYAKTKPKNKNKSNKSGDTSATSAKGDCKEPAVLSPENSSAALASETTDQDDEFERKLESDVNNLVDDCDDDIGGDESKAAAAANVLVAELKDLSISEAKATPTTQKPNKTDKAFVYTLPSDVIKTAYNRHQRGMMDPRLYQLLTKKEIVFTQVSHG